MRGAGCGFSLLEVLAGEGLIDSKGRACTFGGGDNGQLNVPDHVTRDEDARDAGGLVLPAPDGAALVDHAAQLMGER